MLIKMPATQLPNGWTWYCWADGSGALYSPNEEKSYFGYDMQTKEYKNIKNEWCYFCFDSLDAYCAYSEQIMTALLKDGNNKQSIESA